MIIKYKDFKIGKENKVELVGLYKEDYIPFSEKNVFFNTKEEENESYYVDPYIIDFKKEGKLPDYLYIDAYFIVILTMKI